MNQYHNEKFKLKLVNLYLAGIPVSTICKDYSIPRSTLYSWIRKFQRKKINKQILISPRELDLLRKKLNSTATENSILKECNCSTMSPLDKKVKAISKLDGKYSIHSLCRALGVRRSTYYHRKLRSPEQTMLEKEDTIFKPLIRDIFNDTKGRIGVKKIKYILNQQGHTISLRRINRLMNEMNLVCITNRKSINYNFHSSMRFRRNMLNQNFLTDKPNKVWVSDITQIFLNYEPYYLCIIIDLFSRKVISYKLNSSQKTFIVKETFRNAFLLREPELDLIFHSDQGGQYISYEFKSVLRKHHTLQSFSNPGCPYDNAVAESFFRSLKEEEVYRKYYKEYNDMAQSIAEYVDFYNNKRPHQTLNYLTPNQYEEKYYNK